MGRPAPACALVDAAVRAMIVAADHPARGVLRAGRREHVMADRGHVLDRLCLALPGPGVRGVMATPEVLEDLLLLGALAGKALFGSVNRGRLQGAAWEVDDPFTAYDADAIAAAGLQGGKMLLRIDLCDPAAPRTLEACAAAVSALAARGLVAMVEPYMARRVDGRLRPELTTEAAARASAIAAGLGSTSAYRRLKCR